MTGTVPCEASTVKHTHMNCCKLHAPHWPTRKQQSSRMTENQRNAACAVEYSSFFTEIERKRNKLFVWLQYADRGRSFSVLELQFMRCAPFSRLFAIPAVEWCTTDTPIHECPNGLLNYCWTQTEVASEPDVGNVMEQLLT